MGIRFFCPNGHRLNVKSFLAGKRGYCPHCGVKLLIPESTQMAPLPREVVAEPIVPPTPQNGPGQSAWYVRPPSGGQFGPATSELIRQWVAEHRVPSDSLVWREGWPDWRPAADALSEVSNVEAEKSLGFRLRTNSTGMSGASASLSPSRGRFRAAAVVVLGLTALVLLATLLLIATSGS